MKTIQATNEEPERLDKALAGLLGVSRSSVAKMIKAEKVSVDGEVGSVKTLITLGQKISYDESLLKKKAVTGKPPELDIIFEDDDVLVINKPAGLLVHKNDSSHEPTLADALVLRNPDVKDVGDHPDRPGIVHRLDKAASGVMITAKNQPAFLHLKDQFKSRKTTKKYTVLVHDVVEKTVDTIDFPIERSKNTGRMAAKPHSQGGRKAITHYEVVKRYGHHTLLDVTIETGRTHQIRAHMFAIGHSVVGDILYAQKNSKTIDIPANGRAGGRIFLHARELTIKLPSGQETIFEAPLPDDLTKLLETLPKN